MARKWHDGYRWHVGAPPPGIPRIPPIAMLGSAERAKRFPNELEHPPVGMDARTLAAREAALAAREAALEAVEAAVGTDVPPPRKPARPAAPAGAAEVTPTVSRRLWRCD